MAHVKSKSKMPPLDPNDTAAVAVRCGEVCFDYKGEDVLVYDAQVNSAIAIADFYVVATATSDPHLRALKNHLEEELQSAGVPLLYASGTPESRWIVLNFSGVLIHLFHTDLRNYYKIEELWKEFPLIYQSPDHA